MNTGLAGRMAVLAAIVGCAAPAAAVIVGGGGASSMDCLVVFDAPANDPPSAPRNVRCTDGDPSCDSDGTVNGLCSIEIAVCANSTFNPGCALDGVSSIGVDHSDDNGDPKFDPDFLALRSQVGMDFSFPLAGPDTCTGTVVIRVPIKGPIGNNKCSRTKKKLRLESTSTAGPDGVSTDTDTLKLSCSPAANGCDPQALYSSTFDRIQRQIFTQSCALSSCHDSQSQAGSLLLETGASYGNLVNQPPVNGSASAAGWLRVDAAQAAPETSFLFHKLEGDLPDAGYGVRMPRNKPKLNKTLRDVIELWIRAGAPPTGWVPDTF
ncbi:MAG: hypothetical protein SF182_11845 [Deltaproteobacteria bacterium]|nr:hypothetical protein [Deltaproteobacteria bacterium]